MVSALAVSVTTVVASSVACRTRGMVMVPPPNAITLADALLEKFGGDSLRELVRNVDGYRAQIEAF